MAKKTKDGFNKFAAGRKQYGAGRPMPTVGPVDKQGYKVRDRVKNVRNAAIQRRLAKLGK